MVERKVGEKDERQEGYISYSLTKEELVPFTRAIGAPGGMGDLDINGLTMVLTFRNQTSIETIFRNAGLVITDSETAESETTE
tara:strand:+ start:228 stop:476 length:249 start_codon:yes stop_codon:yes gene_type:complete